MNEGRRRRTVTVVGGGVYGMTAALELAQRGHDVTLVDAGRVPHPNAASTDISKAVRMDYGDDAFYADLARRAIDGWSAWNRAQQAEPLYHEVGILLLAARPLERGGFEADSFRLLGQRGIPVERLGPQTLARRFPAWAGASYPDGYFNPCAGFVESGRVVQWLARRAVAAGVRLREEARCSRLLEQGKRVTGVLLDSGERLSSDRVVVACGAWTPFLVPQVSELLRATAQPVCHFRPAERGAFEGQRFPVWCADISGTGWYGFPLSRDGLLKVGHHGPGRPFAPGDEFVVTEDEKRACAEWVAATFRDRVGVPVALSRLCLYCDSRDGDFLIDHDPERQDLIVAAGDSGHGFKFAPLLGGIIADVVERKPNPDSGRFAWRHLGAARREQARQRTAE